MPYVKTNQNNPRGRVSASKNAPSPEDTAIYTVKQIIAEKLLCNTIAEGADNKPPANPLSTQRIKLTAVVADADGNPPQDAAQVVTWAYTDTLPAGAVWWYTDLTEQPTKDTQTTNTITGDPDKDATVGTTSIWLAGTEMFAGNVSAATSAQLETSSQFHPSELTLAVWDFDGAADLAPPQGQTLMPKPQFAVSSGTTIEIPEYDLGAADTFNPRYQYAVSEDLYPDPRYTVDAVYFVRHWNYKDKKDVILMPPQIYGKGSFAVSIPYQIMNTDDVESANAVTYCFYSVFNPYWSETFAYKAAGDALFTPDVLNHPMTTSLRPVLYVEPDVDVDWKDTTDKSLWPTIVKSPPVITGANFGQQGFLNFAIPKYPNWNENDEIVITAFINGYLSDGTTVHNTTVAPPGSKEPYTVSGKDFSSNFNIGPGFTPPPGVTEYALVQFQRGDFGDTEADQLGDNGVMFVQYIVNSMFYSSFFFNRLDVTPVTSSEAIAPKR